MLQLELNLWEQLREAEAAPTAIDFRQLCLSFDAELARMTAKEKMIQGADAIQQLADLLALRAESYFEEWQQRFDPVGPSLEVDDFADLIRQSFSLELNDLIEDPEATYRLPSDTENFTKVGSREAMTPRPSHLDLDVPVSVHPAPDVLSLRFAHVDVIVTAFMNR